MSEQLQIGGDTFLVGLSAAELGRGLAAAESRLVRKILGEDGSPEVLVRAALRKATEVEKPAEHRWSFDDVWTQRVFAALCGRYGLEVYRAPRQREKSLSFRAPPSFVREVFEPIFQHVGAVLDAWFEEQTAVTLAEWGLRPPGLELRRR